MFVMAGSSAMEGRAEVRKLNLGSQGSWMVFVYVSLKPMVHQNTYGS